jgi:hypothetical protein
MKEKSKIIPVISMLFYVAILSVGAIIPESKAWHLVSILICAMAIEFLGFLEGSNEKKPRPGGKE